MGKYGTGRLKIGSVAYQYEWGTPMCEAPQACCGAVRFKSLLCLLLFLIFASILQLTKLDSNEQLLFLSLQNQKGFNMHNAISLISVVYDVTNSWITHIKCVIVARCYSAPPPFRQSHVDDEESALVLIVVLKMWIEGSVQDHHVVEGFRLVDHHF